MRAPLYLLASRDKIDTEISKQVSDTCEQLMTEMGAELHDDLIQKLSIFRLYMDRIERARNYPDELDQLVLKMRSEFQEVIEAVRKISRQLMPVKMEDDPFSSTIGILCQNMGRASTEHIHCQSIGDEQKMSPVAEAYLYRIVQELIHNAFKHSTAWHVWVRLKWKPNRLTIEVEDDGTGFHKIDEFVERLRKKHNTLRMRTKVLGATIRYQQGQKGLLVAVEYVF